jgi:hypothetical protein
MDNLYELILDETDDTGLFAVGFVANPAIEIQWQKFSKAKEMAFAVINPEKRVVAGPLMLADTPIRRMDENGEYHIIIRPETNEKMLMRFFKQGLQDRISVDHVFPLPGGAYLFQAFIINREIGINPPKGFEEVKDGSIFGFYKVENENLWEEYIKTGQLTGFSIEGRFVHRPITELAKQKSDNQEPLLASLERLIDAINTKIEHS